MSDTVTLQPKPGLKLRKPDGSIMAEAGEAIVMDSFWKRRLLDGDVTVKSPAPAAKAK
ncbi:DUF2635 domain-containing protein [Ferrovibrio sp.]|uniref:DUF2635 domain-containing protein n=1 Tax=Ferrovibrio sp. TaxID=1917215 RepID=UPI0035AE525F